jgi:two-component system sensor histidine kinase YesM
MSFLKRVWKSSGISDVLYRLSFKRRIWISFVLLITLAITASGSISYLIASSVVQKNAFASSQDTVNKSAQILDDKLRNIANSVGALMLSDPFRKVMSDVQSGNDSRYYYHLSSLQLVFSQVGFSDSLIENILIATPIGDFYLLSNIRSSTASFYDTSMYEEVKKTRRGIWVQGHEDTFFSSRRRVLSLVVEGVPEDAPFQPNDAYVIVNIKEKELMQLSTQNLSKDGRDYYVINAKGEQVILNQTGSLPVWGEARPDFLDRMTEEDTGSFFYGTSGNDYLVNYKRLDINRSNGWMVVGMQSKEQLLREVRNIKQATYLVILGFVLLSLLFTNKLTSLLLRPLYRLQSLMRRVEDNNLTVRFESRFQDEVAQVGFRFNRMLDEITLLIDNVKRGETEKRKAEMKALTAQMNPHFFYNTLNTIYCKSVLGENEDASSMILALSDMFQLGLNVGRELIRLEDELRHVEQYVAIQQISYEQLFEFSVELEDEALLPSLVPKIILQPLVENSILHGFKNIRSGGKIGIRVSSEADMLHLTVWDNGAGLAAERILPGAEEASGRPEEVAPGAMDEAAGRRASHKHGYALRNIVHRLKLYYGEAAGLEMRGRPEGGAVAEIRLPIHEEDAEHADDGYETMRN